MPPRAAACRRLPPGFLPPRCRRLPPLSAGFSPLAAGFSPAFQRLPPLVLASNDACCTNTKILVSRPCRLQRDNFPNTGFAAGVARFPAWKTVRDPFSHRFTFLALPSPKIPDEPPFLSVCGDLPKPTAAVPYLPVYGQHTVQARRATLRFKLKAPTTCRPA